MGAVVTVAWTSAAAGTAVLAVTAPDGTTVTTSAVVNPGPAHTATFTAVQAGRYFVAWHITGADTYTDMVDVWPADPRFIISLADARQAISSVTASTASDDDMRVYIAAVTPIIEDICGPVLLVTQTKTGDASDTVLVLPHSDVTVTAVTVDGVAAAADTWTANNDAGIVYATGTSFGGDVLVVTYTAGAAIIPPNLRMAAREEVRFLWQIGKQGARPNAVQQDTAMAWTPSGFAVPRRVIELCAPNSTLGGFG